MEEWDTNLALTVSDIFNIGYGKAITIIELAKAITNDIVFVDKEKVKPKQIFHHLVNF